MNTISFQQEPVSFSKEENTDLQILRDTNFNLKQYIQALDVLNVGIFVVNEDFTIAYMNETMKKWFGDQMQKICYKTVANLDTPCPYCQLNSVIAYKEKVHYKPTTPDGRTFEIVAIPIQNSDGTTSKMEIIKDITQELKTQELLEKEKEQLAFAAQHDLLTGLPNRTLFQTHLNRSLHLAHRNNTQLALFFIDLDHFKIINDTFGHDVGDLVLQRVVEQMQEVIRKSDILARLGGDEFILLIDNVTSRDDLMNLANKLLFAISQPIFINELHDIYIGASIGISLYPDDAQTSQELLKHADMAMYYAKSKGRNTYKFFS